MGPGYLPRRRRASGFEATDDGFLLVAYGIKDGNPLAERPTPIVADGRRRPIVDLNGRPIAGVPAGAVCFGAQPDHAHLEAGAEVGRQVLGAAGLPVFQRTVKT